MTHAGMTDLIYYCMVGALFTHELDATKRHEWRILPLTSFLPETVGEQTFIWLHLPLFTVLLLGGESGETNGVRLGLAAFAILHVGLHWLYRKHPANEFNNLSSWALILSAGALGAAYLAMSALS